MAQKVNFDVLKSLPSQTQAHLKLRKPLQLTPAELSLLGLRSRPIESLSLLVQLKCGHRSLLNDKRREFGFEPFEPEQTLPWGKWEIEDAVILYEHDGEVERYLRYYDSLDDSTSAPLYFDGKTGELLNRLMQEEIKRLVRRRYRHKSDPVHLVKFEYIEELTTLDKDGYLDIDIIETLQD